MDNTSAIIRNYFKDGFTYSEILDFLSTQHNINMSLSSLQRRLVNLGLHRKNITESLKPEIIAAVMKELSASGYNLGYRAMWARLKQKYNLVVKRDTVYKIMLEADPQGISERFGNRLRRRVYRSPGPNYVWHLDGYDKLKPFGFSVHGCIDGFSRKLIWLDVATTNKDPTVVAVYYLKALKEFNLIPCQIRADKGTENVWIESMQIYLRHKHNDKFAGKKSYVKGKSTANQRIESYWGQMRKHCADFYIQLFNYMRSQQLFDDSSLHKKCLQYCFGPLIRHDLYMTKEEWNKHRIRKQRNRSNPFGKPDVMYYLPQRYDARDHKFAVDAEKVDTLMNEFTTKPILIDPDFKELVTIVLPDAQVAKTPREALKLYTKILERIKTRKDLAL